MTTDEIAAVLDDKLNPLVLEIRRMAAEVERLRRALPLVADLGDSQDLDESAESGEQSWVDDLEESDDAR